MFSAYCMNNDKTYQLDINGKGMVVTDDWLQIYSLAFKFAREHPNYIVSVVNNDTGEILVDFQ